MASVEQQYNAGERRRRLLHGLGAAVRARRSERGLTIKALAKIAKVSERFLASLEAGEGNISVARLADVADALETSPAELLSRPASEPKDGVIALLGLRGAGKSAIGARLARELRVPFVELDALVSKRAGVPLPVLFEMHGEAYFRRLEREVLEELLAEQGVCVIATSGSLVESEPTYALLRSRARTVWLKARASDHWDRVVAQGDARPMMGRSNAKSELKALLERRAPLYARADLAVDTTGTLDEATNRVLRALTKVKR